MRRMSISLAVVLMTGLGSPALAAEDQPGSGIGLSATVGAGFVGFIDSISRASADTGVCWTARMVFGTMLPISAELAYLGTGQTMSDPGMSDHAILSSHGVETALRWNFLSTVSSRITKHGRFDPYLFGGIGYRRYALINTSYNRSSMARSDEVGEVPAGFGLAWIRNRLVLDFRSEYRFTFRDDLFFGARLGTDNWNASLRMGVEF